MKITIDKFIKDLDSVGDSDDFLNQCGAQNETNPFGSNLTFSEASS